jgi:hypothetical protein
LHSFDHDERLRLVDTASTGRAGPLGFVANLPAARNLMARLSSPHPEMVAVSKSLAKLNAV